MDDLFSDCERFGITLSPKDRTIAELHAAIWKWERRLEGVDDEIEARPINAVLKGLRERLAELWATTP